MSRKRKPDPTPEEMVALVHKYVGPNAEKLTCDELLAWIEARKQDYIAMETAALRRARIPAPADLVLIGGVMKALRLRPDVTTGECLDLLRKRRRLTPRQQEALQVWDRYYSFGCSEIPLGPDPEFEANVDRVIGTVQSEFRQKYGVEPWPSL